MLRHVILGLILALATGPAVAQSAESFPPRRAPAPGDHWTYEIRDEITGRLSGTQRTTVTDVTPTRIVARYTVEGVAAVSGNFIYDRSWNVIENAPWRFSPHDGQGVQFPLAIGKTWVIQADGVNDTSGAIAKIEIKSKIVGQETIASRAGTFETFKIETQRTARPGKDPTRVIETTRQRWWAPAIDRWVKGTNIERINKLVTRNETIEMTEYGSRP